MNESPVGRGGFASAAAACCFSTGTADAMGRKDTLEAWRRLRPSPEKWEAAGDGFRMRARTEQSIDGRELGVAFWQFVLGRPTERGGKQERRRFG